MILAHDRYGIVTCEVMRIIDELQIMEKSPKLTVGHFIASKRETSAIRRVIDKKLLIRYFVEVHEAHREQVPGLESESFAIML
ncbi:hypothetical protein AVEN_89060-1 [Araneus ventricosus]|uniref:Uncharacterized protein n=1 Tax=Araneus ventricosus TaxID=182803 RepID=A0A4Y2B1Z0_ARAVE|nr:hypothetical protein AVEN_89060-1 [Araneus ventricosus]